jgi:hypothetical protein
MAEMERRVPERNHNGNGLEGFVTRNYNLTHRDVAIIAGTIGYSRDVWEAEMRRRGISQVLMLSDRVVERLTAPLRIRPLTEEITDRTPIQIGQEIDRRRNTAFENANELTRSQDYLEIMEEIYERDKDVWRLLVLYQAVNSPQIGIEEDIDEVFPGALPSIPQYELEKKDPTIRREAVRFIEQVMDIQEPLTPAMIKRQFPETSLVIDVFIRQGLVPSIEERRRGSSQFDRAAVAAFLYLNENRYKLHLQPHESKQAVVIMREELEKIEEIGNREQSP